MRRHTRHPAPPVRCGSLRCLQTAQRIERSRACALGRVPAEAILPARPPPCEGDARQDAHPPPIGCRPWRAGRPLLPEDSAEPPSCTLPLL
eukprot:631891-Prymnesium_polylepis.1